ncbi:DUF4307 domain-containing protein [Nocardioides sp.]|uniref:DUF4307 domain-containing protein n=1 Tax=Nocardioides sp. TaxID=35761 RepID=UPI002723A254|nr:DUF4307 domain-containing protein [Nocardioides sp.]MDO9458468.1 DUF4307 domain-containing protein [Nocardioides sp.]
MTTTGSTDLAERYGAPAPWRRRALLGSAAVVVLVFGGWLAWATLAQANPDVASGDLTFSVVDDGTALARFTVDLSGDDVEATCTVKAYAEDHTLVGQVSFTPEPGADGTVQQEVSTERRATSVELVGCTAPGQNRPR